MHGPHNLTDIVDIVQLGGVDEHAVQKIALRLERLARWVHGFLGDSATKARHFQLRPVAQSTAKPTLGSDVQKIGATVPHKADQQFHVAAARKPQKNANTLATMPACARKKMPRRNRSEVE
jgi:hypothetical protein